MRWPGGEFTVLFSSARRKKKLNSPQGGLTERTTKERSGAIDDERFRVKPGMTGGQARNDGRSSPE